MPVAILPVKWHPDVRASHPALWIGLSEWQQQLPYWKIPCFVPNTDAAAGELLTIKRAAILILREV
jgi:hypothetical protein